MFENSGEIIISHDSTIVKIYLNPLNADDIIIAARNGAGKSRNVLFRQIRGSVKKFPERVTIRSFKLKFQIELLSC